MQLVAANDSRYIPGMIKLGASREEIDDIRRADRAAQGVSEGDDERLAEESLKKRISPEVSSIAPFSRQ